MRRLLLALLVTLSLPAAAETVGTLDLQRPGQWGCRVDEATGLATMSPYGAGTSPNISAVVLPPEKSELSLDDWVAGTRKGMLTGSKVHKDVGSAELGSWKHRTARMEGSAGKKWIRLYAVKTTKGMQAVFLMADSKALFDENVKHIDTMVAGARYPGQPLPRQPRIKAAWRGIMMRTRYDPASKRFRQTSEMEHLVLFEDGKALRAWPQRGVAWEDVSADAAKGGDEIVGWTETEKGIVIQWHEGSETVLAREGEVLEKLPKNGKGTYEIRACTLLLTYEDGTTKSIAYEVMEGTAEKPVKIALNTHGLDLKK